MVILIEVVDQGVMGDAIMLNLWLLKLFALFIMVSQYNLAEPTLQNQKYFKKVRSRGKYDTIIDIGWAICVDRRRIKF